MAPVPHDGCPQQPSAGHVPGVAIWTEQGEAGCVEWGLSTSPCLHPTPVSPTRRTLSKVLCPRSPKRCTKQD